MFATFAGGYNRKPLPGLDDRLGESERALREGRIGAAEFEAAADEFVREVMAEMAVVQLTMLGDGGVRTRDRVLPLIRGLTGLAEGAPAALADGEPATKPLVNGPIEWREPIYVRDWEFAAGQTELPVKQTIVGPWSLAALAEPASVPDRLKLANSLADALNGELRNLAEAGCPIVEIDEPALLTLGEDGAGWRAVTEVHRRLTARMDDPSAAHLSLGLWGAPIPAAASSALLDLPYSSYLVDVLAGPSAWRFIDAVPPERGIIVGAADASTETMDETEVLIWAMAWAAHGGRDSTRVGVAPNGALWRLPRHFAHRKCLRVGESVQVAHAGPLHDVAIALDEHPDKSWMPELRALARSVEEARSA